MDSSPALSHDSTEVYVGSWDNKLYAISTTDGSEVWSYETNSYVTSSPAVGINGRIYFGSMDSIFYALEKNGTKAWEYFAGQPIFSSPSIGQEGTIYFGDENGTLHAVNPDGSVKWTYEVEEVADTNKSILSSPALDALGNIYFGSGNGYCYSLSDDGEQASLNWKYQTSDRVDASPVLGSTEEVFFVSRDGYLRSLPLFSATTDNLANWEKFVGDVFYSSPVVDANGRVYVIGYTGGGENHLFAYDANGSKAWDSNVSDPPFSIDAVVDSSLLLDQNGALYFGCFDKKLYSLDLGVGRLDSHWPMFKRSSKRNGDWPSFSLSLESSPLSGGSTEGNGLFYQGTSASISANPDTGYSFSGWSGGGAVDPNASSTTVDMSQDRNLSASFSLNSYDLTVLAGSGGSVTGSGSFSHGTSPSISATPDTGYSFIGWSGEGTADPNASSTTVDMSQTRTLSASFSLNSYDLTVLAGSGGSVTGSGSFSHGTSPSISANPDTGYSFNGWSGEGTADPNASSTTVDMSQARSLSASFSLNSYDLTVLAESGGSVSGGGSFPYGSLVNVSATPNSGYSFVQWVGAGISDSTAPNTTLIMNSDQSITAQFAQSEQSLFTLVLQANPQSSGILIGDGNYPQDQNVSISAEPIAGYSFDRWEGYPINNSPDSNTSLILDSNITITAHFTRLNYLINLDSPGGGTVTGTGTYAFGSEANLSAEASTGYQFDYWNGTGIPDPLAPVFSLTVSQDLSLEAIFSPLPYTLTLNGSLGGSASFSGTNPFSYDSNVSITATANAGYTFTGWTGLGVANSDASSTTVHITQDRNLSATFETVDFSLIVLKNLSNAGTVTGGGFYQAFESIPVSASINPGYQFSHWLGLGIEEPLNPQTRILLNKDSLITASFSLSEFSQYIEAEALNDSWFSSWLGSIFQSSTGWIYHWPLGWLFPQLDESGIWIWQEDLGWLWTQKEIFNQKFLWQSSIENWIYLETEETSAPRFFDYESNSWKDW